jgi:hypothetical protein
MVPALEPEPGTPTDPDLQRLLAAQRRAWALVAEAQARAIVAPGRTESEASRRIHALARDMFGVRRHWHKRIVRSGPNTLLPYREDPPDRVLLEDDIAFLDLGPVFGDWEADVGVTLVLGDDAVKHRLARDTEAVWRGAKAWADATAEATAAGLHHEVARRAAGLGWKLGGSHVGHLVGRFPHERIEGDGLANYLHPGNPRLLREAGPDGRPRRWILEVHLVDPSRGIGGFFEQMLDTPDGEGGVAGRPTRQATLTGGASGPSPPDAA